MKKVCTACKEEKPLSEYHLAKAGKCGRRAYCKVCRKKKEKLYNVSPQSKKAERERCRAYRKTEKGKAARAKIMGRNYERCEKRRAERTRERLYGLGGGEFDRLVESQGGKCLICDVVPNTRLAVDHSHENGRVRGLLCSKCNLGLGCFKDNPQFLTRAAEYLKAGKTL